MHVLETILGRELMPLYEKVANGERLSFADGMTLYTTPNLSGVGYLANLVRERLNGDYAYYIRNQHINYTNICNKGCKFCSFYAQKGGPKPYTLTMDEVRERLRAYKHIPITEVHIVGGVNPRLPYQYYLDLVRTVKEERPEVHIKAFTAVEWEEIARVARKPLREVLEEMKQAGLGSVPGGGIEVLSDRIHAELFPKKINGKRWKEIAREIAAVGLKQYATLLYGMGRDPRRARRSLHPAAQATGRDGALSGDDAALVPPRRHATGALAAPQRRRRPAQYRRRPPDAGQLPAHQVVLDYEHAPPSRRLRFGTARTMWTAQSTSTRSCTKTTRPACASRY
jgi:2-iminoacetate synthase ThiH